MNPKSANYAIAAFLAIGALCSSQPAEAKKKKKRNSPRQSFRKRQKTAWHSIKRQDASVTRGMFNTYLDNKGKLYFEIPDSVLGKTYMLVNRVNSLSQTNDWVAGQVVSSRLIRFSRNDNNLFITLPQSTSVVKDDDPIRASFDLNFAEPILKSFKIDHKSNGKIYVDVTSFFAGNEKSISRLRKLIPYLNFSVVRMASRAHIMPMVQE